MKKEQKIPSRPAPPFGGAANLKGFAPFRRTLKLDGSMIRCFDDSMIRLLVLLLLACFGCFACFACYMACLLGSISAAWDGFGSHIGDLGDILGMGWDPDWPGDRRMGWIALPPGWEQCFTRIQGSRARPKCKVDLAFLGPTINLTTA